MNSSDTLDADETPPRDPHAHDASPRFATVPVPNLESTEDDELEDEHQHEEQEEHLEDAQAADALEANSRSMLTDQNNMTAKQREMHDKFRNTSGQLSSLQETEVDDADAQVVAEPPNDEAETIETHDTDRGPHSSKIPMEEIPRGDIRHPDIEHITEPSELNTSRAIGLISVSAYPGPEARKSNFLFLRFQLRDASGLPIFVTHAKCAAFMSATREQIEESTDKSSADVIQCYQFDAQTIKRRRQADDRAFVQHTGEEVFRNGIKYDLSIHVCASSPDHPDPDRRGPLRFEATTASLYLYVVESSTLCLVPYEGTDKFDSARRVLTTHEMTCVRCLEGKACGNRQDTPQDPTILNPPSSFAFNVAREPTTLSLSFRINQNCIKAAGNPRNPRRFRLALVSHPLGCGGLTDGSPERKSEVAFMTPGIFVHNNSKHKPRDDFVGRVVCKALTRMPADEAATYLQELVPSASASYPAPTSPQPSSVGSRSVSRVPLRRKTGRRNRDGDDDDDDSDESSAEFDDEDGFERSSGRRASHAPAQGLRPSGPSGGHSNFAAVHSSPRPPSSHVVPQYVPPTPVSLFARASRLGEMSPQSSAPSSFGPFNSRTVAGAASSNAAHVTCSTLIPGEGPTSVRTVLALLGEGFTPEMSAFGVFGAVDHGIDTSNDQSELMQVRQKLAAAANSSMQQVVQLSTWFVSSSCISVAMPSSRTACNVRLVLFDGVQTHELGGENHSLARFQYNLTPVDYQLQRLRLAVQSVSRRSFDNTADLLSATVEMIESQLVSRDDSTSKKRGFAKIADDSPAAPPSKTLRLASSEPAPFLSPDVRNGGVHQAPRSQQMPRTTASPTEQTHMDRPAHMQPPPGHVVMMPVGNVAGFPPGMAMMPSGFPAFGYMPPMGMDASQQRAMMQMYPFYGMPGAMPHMPSGPPQAKPMQPPPR
ncbi:transcription factor unc-3 [Capsaspora owczarzaki ATCC 30864]|uniref:transcription factor unc-3 n=1 Tax=Capsaspora owczarzaki (strain ATCC 30864) TaxID=595528 RepID=UPI00035233DA|nr:transcription factor unc-3 [Capsaspora owczarzaki ATCC 30864]|eukprot:XP_004345219.2 transcription factor unc-3 [Capsaspora owczarzaki ATCC 30864]